MSTEDAGCPFCGEDTEGYYCGECGEDVCSGCCTYGEEGNVCESCDDFGCLPESAA